MKRIIFLTIVFISCCVALFKAVAVLVPFSVFSWLAGQFHIYGDEAVTDFMVMANIVISVILSLLLVFTLPKSSRKPH
ncbi:hypothetical protein ACRPH4_22935 (plasmid) [Pantoea allii]|uniref:hypothetical protein n=1 Tax=Pantoea allii TaxID=574096 RepID=UPI003D7906ED